jgi:hypothetical protein
MVTKVGNYPGKGKKGKSSLITLQRKGVEKHAGTILLNSDFYICCITLTDLHISNHSFIIGMKSTWP